MDQKLFQSLLEQEIAQMCQFALAEDLADCSINADSARDITAELIPKDKIASATLITREAGVLCGTAWVDKIFELLGGNVTIKWNFQDGDKLSPEDVICTLEGNARELLTGERSAMNFVQSLSATATLTSLYAEPLVGTNCRLLDTRKTLPGMRFGQKYAVKCGGGTNHRIGLSDAFLIKENHIMACGGIPQALNQAILNHPDKLLEIEVESLDELQQALDGKAQVIMLDNFSLEQMREAKKQRDQHSSKVLLEASGNVSLEAIKSIADTGVDYISVGALTKNVQALDLSMRISIDLK